MARTFQNIRLWKTQTVFDNVLIAKHCRATSSVFSAAFRLNRKEEAAQRARGGGAAGDRGTGRCEG